MNKLSFLSCDRVSQIEWPCQSLAVSMHSKATEITTDFKLNSPLVIDSNTKAVEAEYIMKKAHVKLQLVLDEHSNFIGTLSFNDLNNQEIVKKVARGDVRSELRVADFMRLKAHLKSIDWATLEQTSIRSLVQTLANCTEQHILVTDNDGNTLRGLISASDVARALHLDVDLNLPVSFRLVNNAIHILDKHAA